VLGRRKKNQELAFVRNGVDTDLLHVITLRDENRVQRGNGNSGREFIPQGRLFTGNVHALDRTYDG